MTNDKKRKAAAVKPITDKNQLEQMKDYLKGRSIRNYVVFMVGINTGLRIKEILNLKVKNIKNGTHIEVNGNLKPMNKVLREVVQTYIHGKRGQEYLFQSREGNNQPIQRSMIYRAMDEAAKHVGITSVGTNSLRKTFGYHLYMQTQDLTMVKAALDYPYSKASLIDFLGIQDIVLEQTINDFSL